jgi:hypothetical protein
VTVPLAEVDDPVPPDDVELEEPVDPVPPPELITCLLALLGPDVDVW